MIKNRIISQSKNKNQKNTSIIQFGLYPQTVVLNKTIIEELDNHLATNNDGKEIIELNGNYYKKLRVTPFHDYYTFDNGRKIIDGKCYWFRCDPIEWIIILETECEQVLMSKKLLDTHIFNEEKSDDEIKQGLYSNNYEKSSLREWLNKDFYNIAFTFEKIKY